MSRRALNPFIDAMNAELERLGDPRRVRWMKGTRDIAAELVDALGNGVDEEILISFPPGRVLVARLIHVTDSHEGPLLNIDRIADLTRDGAHPMSGAAEAAARIAADGKTIQ